jgi:hypothetical protein
VRFFAQYAVVDLLHDALRPNLLCPRIEKHRASLATRDQKLIEPITLRYLDGNDGDFRGLGRIDSATEIAGASDKVEAALQLDPAILVDEFPIRCVDHVHPFSKTAAAYVRLAMPSAATADQSTFSFSWKYPTHSRQ